MDLVKLSRISMKHLITLHIMLETLSVTVAATRLCVSPSSISKTLGQLRDTLDDELFYRHGNQLVATALARRLGPSVHQIIHDMNQLLTQEAFSPMDYQGRFSLAMRESTFELLAPKLSAHILALAPHVRLDIHSKDKMGFAGLSNGELDFIILPHDRSQPPSNEHNWVWETVMSDDMVCLMSPAHPLLQGVSKNPYNNELTLDDYLSYGHIGISDVDLNIPFFEMLLAQQALTRKIVISVADFGSAALLCHHSELLFTCSRRWAESALQAQGLVRKNLPFSCGDVVYSLVWHQPNMNDPAHRWMHQQIRLCCSDAEL